MIDERHNGDGGGRPDVGHGPSADAFRASAEADAASRTELPWRVWLGVVLARKWYLLGTAAAVVLAVAVHTYRLPNVYRATARVLIESENPKVLDIQDVMQVTETWQNEYYQTQCKVIESRRVAEKVFQQMDLWKHPDLKDATDPLGAFLSHVRVQPIRNSRLVDVSVEHGDPATAAAWAQGMVTGYIADTLDRRSGMGKDALAQLSKESDEMRSRLEAKEEAIQAFREKRGLVSVSERQSLLERRLGELSTLATSAEKARRDLEASQERLAALVAQGNWGGLFALAQAQDSDLLRTIRAEQVRLQQERQEMAKTYREKHPKLVAVESRLDSLQASLKQEAERVAEGMRLAYEEAAGRERKALEALEGAKAEKVQLDRDVMELTKLQREADAATSLFQNILKRIQETSVSSGIELTNISVVDRPVVPAAPAAPNRKMHLALGLAAGLALGLGVAFLVEQVDPTIDAPDEAERVIGGPLLGVIPHFGDSGNGFGPKYYESTGQIPPRQAGDGAASPAPAPRAPTGSRILRAIGLGDAGRRAASPADGSELVCHTDMKSRASEAFRAVRTAIQFAGRESVRKGGGEVKSLAVVSVAPQEGKTLAALNLAVAMAQVGHRVLVVDADLRRPRVHKALGMDGAGAGLSEVLQGTATLDDVARETKVEGLWVVTAGAIPPNPSELLSSPRLAMFVHEAEGRFDRVLFDSPPVAAVTDACVLAPALDAVVQVIGFGRASRQEVREGKRQLESLGARYLGAIFNDVPTNRKWYGKIYGYGYTYAYYEKYSGYYDS